MSFNRIANRLRPAAVLAGLLLLLAGTMARADDWRGFRGLQHEGVSDEVDLPVQLDQPKNLAWKVPLPGRGPSSPVVAGGRVYVTCSSGPREDRLHAICFDAATGRQLWHRQLWATGHTTCHPFGANAAPTPAVTGDKLFAFYSSNDLACFDLDGNLRWFRGLAYDFPAARNDVGMASSPLPVGDVVVVQVENQGDSFAAGIDQQTGETRWQIPLEPEAMWTSPTMLPGNDEPGQGGAKDLVLLQQRTQLGAHDPATGKQVWKFEAQCHSITSAIVVPGSIYLPAEGLAALDLSGSDTPALRWHESGLRSGNSGPLAAGDRVYVMKGSGILACGDVANGELLWQLRLKGPFWASSVLAGDHVYCVNHSGLVQVVRTGEQGERVATCQLDEGVLASPAVADGAIYFRTDQHLWKFARPAAND